jgi:hypothetical protein
MFSDDLSGVEYVLLLRWGFARLAWFLNIYGYYHCFTFI